MTRDLAARGPGHDAGHPPVHRRSRSPTPTWPRSSGTPAGRRPDRTGSRSASSCCATVRTRSPPRRCSARRSATGWNAKRVGRRLPTVQVRRLDAALRRPLRAGSRSSCSSASSATGCRRRTKGRRCIRPARTCCSPPVPSATAARSRCGITASRPSCASCSTIPDGVALSACITLGVPAGHHGPLKRKPVGEITFDDAWGRSPDWV